MTKNLKRMLLVALVAAVTSHVSFTHEDCSYCGDVFVESPDYTVDAHFRALIFRPSANNIYYAAQAKPLPIQSPNWNIFDLRPKHHFGFDIGASIICHDRCANIAFNYERFKSTTEDTHQVPLSTDMIGPFFAIGPEAEAYKAAAGKVTFTYNAGHLAYGHFVQIGDCLQTNFFAGIQVASIKQELVSVFSNTEGTIVRDINSPSRFTGAGPEFGCDFTYSFWRDLDIMGKFSTAILVGPSKNETTFTSISPELQALNFPSPNVQKTEVQNRTQVVPAFEERLGIAYSFCWCDHKTVTLEAGYEARIYLNAIQSVEMGSQVEVDRIPEATVGVFARTFRRTLGNFALTGPYVAFNVTF